MICTNCNSEWRVSTLETIESTEKCPKCSSPIEIKNIKQENFNHANRWSNSNRARGSRDNH